MHKVCRGAGCRATLGNHAENDRVALLIDHRLNDARHVGRLGERILQLDDAWIGTAVIATRLRHLGRQLILQVERLLLLGLGGRLLLLERVGLLLERRGLLLQHRGLLLQTRSLGAQRCGLLFNRDCFGRHKVSPRLDRSGSPGVVLLLLRQDRQALLNIRTLCRPRGDRLL